MDKKLYLGLDVSTQGAKIVVLDFMAKQVVLTESISFDRDLSQYGTENGTVKGLGTGVSESDPCMWIDSVRILFSRLKNSIINTAEIVAISVSGQQHGLVALDAEGNLTRERSKLWNDVSTEIECKELTKAGGGIQAVICEVLNSIKPGYTASKILHFKKENPTTFAKTSTFFLVHNFINWFLTGAKNGGVRAMEPGDASGIALWNPKSRSWSKTLLNAIDMNLETKFPIVNPTDEFIGTIGNNLCAEFGFSPKCMIAAGSGDNMFAAVGTGNVSPGQVTISLGTSGTACTIFNRPYFDPMGEIASYCDSFGNYMALLCVSNLANGYNKALEKYAMTHGDFESMVMRTPAGNNGRILIPWFVGERTPDLPHATPIFFGFGLDDMIPEFMCRGILEGHVMNLYEGFLRLPVKPKNLRLTGGIAQSPVWRQAISNIFNLPVILIKGEGAALGAAINAAYIDNKLSANNIQDFVDPFIDIDESASTFPEQKHEKTYAAFRATYLSLSSRICHPNDDTSPFMLRKNIL
jgi:xylulokinase